MPDVRTPQVLCASVKMELARAAVAQANDDLLVPREVPFRQTHYLQVSNFSLDEHSNMLGTVSLQPVSS